MSYILRVEWKGFESILLSRVFLERGERKMWSRCGWPTRP